jgi:hypothetical protein
MALYSPAIGHPLQGFDDPEYVTANTHIRGAELGVRCVTCPDSNRFLDALGPRMSFRAGNNIPLFSSASPYSFGVSSLAGEGGVLGLAGAGCCVCFAAGGGLEGLASGFGVGLGAGLFGVGGGVPGFAGCG